MAANETVRAQDCEQRRKELYDKVNNMTAELNQIKGGLAIVKYAIPIMIATLGCFIKLQIDSIKAEIKRTPATIIRSSPSIDSAAETRESIKANLQSVPELSK